MEMSSVSLIGRFTPKRKSPWCPLDRRLGGPQRRSGRGGEEENSQPLPGLEPLIIQPVTQRYTTELSRLWNNKVLKESAVGLTTEIKVSDLRNFGVLTNCSNDTRRNLLRQLTLCIRVLPEKLTVTQLAKKFPPIMEPEGSFPCSQEPATGPYPEPDTFSVA
jgi:hypothetical protein